MTLDFTTKEASGRVLLGILVVELANALKCILKKDMFVEYEFPVCETGKAGPDFALDMAVVTIHNNVSAVLLLVYLFPPPPPPPEFDETDYSMTTNPK